MKVSNGDDSREEQGAGFGGRRTAPAKRYGSIARWAFHGTVALGLFGLVLWRAEPGALGDEYSGIDVPSVVGAVALNVPLIALLALRGRLTLAGLGHDIGFWPVLPITTLANVVGALTPAAAGDLIRTPFFKERHDVSYADGLATVIYERGLSLFVLALSTGVAAAWSTLAVAWAAAVTAAAVGVAVAAPPVAAIVLSWFRPALNRADAGAEARSLVQRGMAALGRSLEALLSLLRHRPTNTIVTIANVAIFAVMAFQMWFVGRALGLGLSPAEAWMVAGTGMLAGIVTFLPLGLGTMDATIAAMVGTIQSDFSAGAAVAVLMRLTVTLPLGLAAVASLLYLMGGRRRVERPVESAP